MTQRWWRDDAIEWKSSPWSLELRGDELAEIRHRGKMILRGVRAAVRDHGWLTVPVHVEDHSLSRTGMVLRLRHEGLGAHLTSELTVASEGAQLRISWDAENQIAFDTNRTGLVVLHPASDAGSSVTVLHDDGFIQQTMFPRAISPHQPIKGIREMRVDSQTSSTTLRFEGDIFEMEDQRNWTDASFKTYSRPLALPFPYPLRRGERVRQSITISVEGEVASVDARADEPIALYPAGDFPVIGVEASTAPDPGSLSADGSFRVVELDLATPAWPAALRRAGADGLPLDLRVVTDGAPEALASVAAALRAHDVRSVSPFDALLHVSTASTVAAMRDALDRAGISAPVVGGTRSHFTELNREIHRLPEGLDAITFTTTPLFHTLDTEQLIEAVPIQRLIAEQAVELAGGAPIHIGPVALRPRFNNVATTPEPAPTRTDLAEGYGAQFTGASDPRQHARELAAWTIASAAALAIPGVATISWFETWGPRGIRGRDGEPTPAAAAIDALTTLTGRALLSGASPDGLVWAIGARSTGDDVILVANLSPRSRLVPVQVDDGPVHESDLGPGTWERIVLPR